MARQPSLFVGDLINEVFQDDFIRRAFADLDRVWQVENTKQTFPPHNVSTNKEGTLVLELALAGYEPSQIAIRAEDQRIVVEGKGKEEEALECYPLWRGIKGADFKARFPISSKFNLAEAKAEFKHGMVIIQVPLAEERKPREIPILIDGA